MKFFLSLIILLLWTSCSDDKQAGVATETHTGSIAGIVLDSLGKPLQARVRLRSQNVEEDGLLPTLEVYANAKGEFLLDRVPDGLWYVHITDTLNNLAWTTSLYVDNQVTSDTNLGTIKVMKAASLVVLLNGLGLLPQDTLFVPGSDVFAVVSSTDLEQGILSLNMISPGAASQLLCRRQDSIIQLQAIPAMDEAQQGLIQEGSDGVISAALQLRRELDIALAQNAGNVFNMPMPLLLPDSLVSPCITNEDGLAIKLDSTYHSGTTTTYWTRVPVLRLGTNSEIVWNVFDQCKVSGDSANILARKVLHFDAPTDSIGVWGKGFWMDSMVSPYVVPSFTTFVDSSSVGVALWVRGIASEQPSTYMRLLESSYQNSGIILQQKSNRSTIELRINTKDGAYNAVFGGADLLDGLWHHYAFSIQGNRVTVVADGVAVADTTFNLGSGFTNSTMPVLGNYPMFHGQLDEVMFFDGTQTATWWRVLYALQDPKTQWDVLVP